MKKGLLLLPFLLCFNVLTLSCPAAAAGDPARAGLEDRIQQALQVLKEVNSTPDRAIPSRLLSRMRAVAVFPSLYKGGLVVGAGYGKGIIMARLADGSWAGPCFVTVKSGSLGWQAGVQSVDLVLVVTSGRGLDSLLMDKVALGGTASAAAGPVGREASASTDLALKAEIYSYSRAKGLFAGVSVKGMYLQHDYRADEAYYGRLLTPREILSNAGLKRTPAATALASWLAGHAR